MRPTECPSIESRPPYRWSFPLTRILGRIAAVFRFTGEYGAAIAGLLGIAMLWTGLLYSLTVERQAAIDKAFDDTNNYALVSQQQVAGIIRGIALADRGVPTSAPIWRWPAW